MIPLKVGQIRISDNFIYVIMTVGLELSRVKILQYQSGESTDWQKEVVWLNRDIKNDPIFIDMDKELEYL